VEDEHSLTWLSQLQGQSGVISRQQAIDAGISAKTIEWRLRSGAWRRVHPGVYATFTGKPSREAKLWAAVLRAGPGAALSHESAAEIHGLIDKPRTMIHISVPEERRPGQHTKIRGVIMHRSRKLVPEWQPPWQLPRTSVEDTVLDLAAAARTFDDAYGWISAAIGRRRTTPDRLSNALALRSRVRWRAWIAAALSDAADGIHSPLERHYVHGVERAHGLPAARRQAKRRHGSGNRYLDNHYEDYGVCVELDGVAAHPAEGRWVDTHRDNINLAQGTQTLRYNWPDATENRCRTAAQIAAVLQRLGWPGAPRRCSPTCQAGLGAA
jgi:very-short-patch-repair endonuclease